MTMKKILLLCGLSNYILYFRSNLIEKLKAEGYEVSVIAFDEKFRAEVETLGVTFYCIQSSNRSVNPFEIFALGKQYRKIIRAVSPDIVFSFQLKPNTFGVLAAKKAGVKNIYSMVEGAGDVFINNTLKWKLVRFVVCRLYKKAFRNVRKVFFLNEDDKQEFIERKLVQSEQCEIIHGIGVDLERFSYRPIKNRRTFLMVARMLKTKGIYEYCECARLVRKQYPDAVFKYLGAEGNVKVADIQEYIDDGSVRYLGTTNDVRPYFEECFVEVLPSYREGLGLVNVEAGAIGRASITCNTIGTKDTVKDGYNGFLVEVGDSKGLAEKAIWCIEHPEEAEQMGRNSRTLAEEYFDQEKINEKIISILTRKEVKDE